MDYETRIGNKSDAIALIKEMQTDVSYEHDNYFTPEGMKRRLEKIENNLDALKDALERDVIVAPLNKT